MKKAIDTVRIVLATALGAGASGAVLYGLARAGTTGVTAPSPLLWGAVARAHVGETIVLFALALGVTGVYATWFDKLLSGSAAWRGTLFGLIAWLWTLPLLVLAWHRTGRFAIGAGLVQTVAATLIASAVYGLVAGIVYGAGRVYDRYDHGLGYGVAPRFSRI